MRVKNKEIRARRHRKEQKIKDAARETRALYAGKESAPKAAVKPAAKPAAKKAPAKKKTDAE
jgi:hypothetical protein